MNKGLFGRLQNEVNARAKTPGISMLDILELPDAQRNLINWMIRENEVSLAQVITFIGTDESSTRKFLDTLLDKGFIREIDMKGQTSYRVRIAPTKKRDMPSNLWQALDGKTDK